MPAVTVPSGRNTGRVVVGGNNGAVRQGDRVISRAKNPVSRVSRARVEAFRLVRHHRNALQLVDPRLGCGRRGLRRSTPEPSRIPHHAGIAISLSGNKCATLLGGWDPDPTFWLTPVPWTSMTMRGRDQAMQSRIRYRRDAIDNAPRPERSLGAASIRRSFPFTNSAWPSVVRPVSTDLRRVLRVLLTSAETKAESVDFAADAG